jgi:hypothetical protein
MKLLLPLLAAVTLIAVGFVLVELHAPITPSPSPIAAPPPPAQFVPPPIAPPPPPPQNSQLPTPNSQPPPSPADPLDVVVRGRSRRDWHAYYSDRQQQLAGQIARYQAVIDRAIAGEEPDPRELGEAHDKVRELNARLKEDLEALQQIDGSP